jgi:small nuclear ribonucleoprotein (snRNP)-like protein
MITTPSDSDHESVSGDDLTTEVGMEKKLQTGSAPGEGAWSKRERRKATIAMKDSKIFSQGAGDGESWKKKRKRVYKDPMENSLAIILESLRGYEVTIDLKNDSTVKGRIESVDKGMNVILENFEHSSSASPVTTHVTENEGVEAPQTQTQTTEIKGTSIYLVHMPSGLDISSHVEKYRHVKDKEKKARSMKAKGLTAQA